MPATRKQNAARRAVAKSDRLARRDFTGEGPLTGADLWSLITTAAAKACNLPERSLLDREEGAEVFSAVAVRGAEYMAALEHLADLERRPAHLLARDRATLLADLTGEAERAWKSWRAARGLISADELSAGLPRGTGPDGKADLLSRMLEHGERAAIRVAERKRSKSPRAGLQGDPRHPWLADGPLAALPAPIRAATATAIMSGEPDQDGDREPFPLGEEYARGEGCEPAAWRKRVSRGGRALESSPVALGMLAGMVGALAPAPEKMPTYPLPNGSLKAKAHPLPEKLRTRAPAGPVRYRKVSPGRRKIKPGAGK